MQHDVSRKASGYIRGDSMTQSESQKRAKDKWNKAHPEKIKEYIARYRKKLKAERPEKIAEWGHRASERRHQADACEILAKHAEDLADDPERLSTEFITGLMGTGEVEE